MAILHIALQDGFAGDAVEVLVNGKEVLNKAGVTTRTQIGFADSFEMTVEEGSLNIEVVLPLRHLQETIKVHVSAAVYVGVSIYEERIAHRISGEPFGYL